MRTSSLRLAFFTGLLSCLPAAPSLAQAGVPGTQSVSALPAALTPGDADALTPGDFLWRPELASEGAIRVIVDLGRQLAFVYRGETLIGLSTVSSGRDGYETPVGTFPILQKEVKHFSNLYGGAAMPYMQRLTWDGVALHAGGVPGYRESHGCVHLPIAFAKLLYGATDVGAVAELADSTREVNGMVMADEPPAAPITSPDMTTATAADASAETAAKPSGAMGTLASAAP